MRPADRIIASPHDARGALVVILLVALLRLSLERVLLSDLEPATHLPPLNLVMPLSNALFYCGCFWLFSLLFSLLLSRPPAQVANAICVGLVFGLLPPLIELYVPSAHRIPFRWYHSLTWTLAEDGQPRAETITLWLLFAATAAWVYYYTRSALRAALGFLGAYLIIQLFTVVVLWTGPSGNHLLGLLALPVICWFALRARVLFRCLLRLNHGLPHGALALLGAAWCGQPLVGIERALVMIAGVFVLLIHNDHYDRREDELAGRMASSTGDDVVWSTAFFVALMLCCSLRQPLVAVLGLSFLLLGFLYHHPSLRLKERFCLSYLVEGAWALIAFVAGAAVGSDVAPGARLVVAGTAIFGGGALLSMPKDWKDVDSDRAARIPTIYVTLTRGGRRERSVHGAVVGAVTLGLLLPPAWLLLRGPIRSPAAAVAAVLVAFVPGALLLAVARRGRAVEASLWALTGYLLLLAAAVGPSRAPRAAPPGRPDSPAPPALASPASTAGARPRLEQLFAPFGVAAIDGEPVDFGRLRRAPSGPGPEETRYQVAPRSGDELARIVALAYAHRVPMRIRGQGHSMNGSTLPAPGELTIRTRGLTGVRFERPGTVTAEAGIPIQDLRQLLRGRFGQDLPVSNGGGTAGGPSIGGFIGAGGFGGGSAEYGGFWENVDAVTLLVLDGARVTRVTIERDDPRFPWLFGAMGQLGVVLEARLDLVAADPARPPSYPEGQVLAVDAPPTDATSLPPIYWYTLFVGPEEREAAARALAGIQARHAGQMTFRTPYSYAIRHRRIAAPLIYPRGGDFFAIGIWGDGPSAATVEALEREVAALSRAAGHRRYVQAEVMAGPEAYRDYFGVDIGQALLRRRQAIDPAGLFNRGTVFREE